MDNPVGLKLAFHEVELGVVETNFTAPDHFQSYPGVLHGGIVATILDEVSGRAHLGDPDQPRIVRTAKLEVKYRKPVPIGQPLRAVGKAGPARGMAVEGWAGIYDQAGTLLAEAKALLVDSTRAASDAERQAIGWRIEPDQ